jgi:phospholipase/lecithinase/hemolysin
LGILLLGLPAHAAFTSFYVFGDGVSTTTNNTGGGSLYYGKRYTNGRVWVEVLVERQGLTYVSNNTCSYFGHTTGNLVTTVNNFNAPGDVATALFVVWVSDADLVYDITDYESNPSGYSWSNAIAQSQTNLWKATTNLYAKGVRTLIMPNAVDLTKIPAYSASAGGNVIRQAITNFNIAFGGTVSNVLAACPDLTIYVPDFFALLDDIVAHSTNYGLTHPDTDALTAYNDSVTISNSVACNYVFWDDTNPSARTHAWMADLVQQFIAPVDVSAITLFNGSNRLDMVNIPIGRDGVVEGTTNLVNWASVGNIDSTNSTQSLYVTRSNSTAFYRLRFPFSWTWP